MLLNKGSGTGTGRTPQPSSQAGRFPGSRSSMSPTDWCQACRAVPRFSAALRRAALWRAGGLLCGVEMSRAPTLIWYSAIRASRRARLRPMEEVTGG